MQLNFTVELAQLMKFTGETATAIRMYSAYSGGSPSTYLHRHEDPKRDSVELMFLADALHHFTSLGYAVEAVDPTEVVSVCDRLLAVFAKYGIEKPEHGARQAKPVFEAWKGLVSLDEVTAALSAMRTKAQSHLATV